MGLPPWLPMLRHGSARASLTLSGRCRWSSYRSQPGDLDGFAVFECKQSWNDLLRDNRRRDELRDRLAQLQERRIKLEALLAVHHPSLRTSDSLFPEWASFDFLALEHQGYRQTIRKIGQVQRQLLQNIKFDVVSHYQLGNLHYLVTPAAMIDPSEVPIGWGFLEVESDGTIIEKTIPTRFNLIGSSDWLVRIGQASTAREIRSLGTEPQVLVDAS
jgi:hypothetical protein